MGWQGWAARTLGPRIGAIPSWTDFWATNGLLIVFGISAAAVGWRAPAFALSFPALCLVNAVFFHIIPTLQESRLNPGVFTATFLYLPIGVWVYVAAASDGALDFWTLVLSLLLGALAMASAVLMLVLGARFRYEDAPTASAAAGTAAPPDSTKESPGPG